MVMPADAVFEGGGVKGIGLVGALCYAEQMGYKWRYVAGTSAGAIVASLVAAGYSANEIKDILNQTDYMKFLDNGLISGVPYIGPVINLNLKNGIHKGKYFEEWIRELLARKGVYTFKHLRMRSKDQQFAYKLRVIAADLSRGALLILPQDISYYGMEPDQLDVARAIRMSMSIPFFYEPIKVDYCRNNQLQTSYVVDGGVLSNYPVWLFDGEINNLCCPTFGFRLHAPVNGVENSITGPLSMLKAMFTTMMEAHDQKYIERAHFARTIFIPSLGVRTTDFDISVEKQTALFQAGAKAAQDFFDIWSYQNFTNEYNIL